VPLAVIGEVSGDALIIRFGGDIIIDCKMPDLKTAYEEVFSCLMQ